MRATAALIAVLALAGCNSGAEDEAATTPAPRPGEPGREKIIRAWSKALNDERYRRAASFFAKGAIVEQSREIRLEDRNAAIAFNLSLPCKADVTDVDDEEGGTVLAAFRLRGGPRNGCDGGSARVRFRFRDGKFIEWRQLPEPETPPGSVI